MPMSRLFAVLLLTSCISSASASKAVLPPSPLPPPPLPPPPGTGSSFNSDSLTSLFSTLFTTFGVIAIGYASKRTGYFSREAKAGLGELVGKVALPALLFRAIATLQLSDLKAEFIVGVLVAKVTLFIVTIGTAKLAGRGLAGPACRERCPGAATAHLPRLQGLTLRRHGHTTHTGRAAWLPRTQREAAGRPRGPATAAEAVALCGSPHPRPRPVYRPLGRRCHLGPLRLQLERPGAGLPALPRALPELRLPALHHRSAAGAHRPGRRRVRPNPGPSPSPGPIPDPSPSSSPGPSPGPSPSPNPNPTLALA